jgi:hypothetical protein
MAGGFHIYFEAARALWDMSTGRLETMARDSKSAAERRAAALTLNLKRDLITPGEFGDERGSLTKLASALLEDKQFTMEMALRLTPKKAKRSAAVVAQSGLAHRKPRHAVMWIAITAGVILLVMDVLATAGVRVPTPIGEILDRVTGEDEAPVLPAPQAPRPDRDRRAVVGEGTDAIPEMKESSARGDDENSSGTKAATRPAEEESEPIVPATTPTASTLGKHPHHAQGKDAHQAQGKEAHQAQGRAEHQPAVRGNATSSPAPQGKAKGHDKNANPGGRGRS